MVNSKQKGNRAERALADTLSEMTGLTVRRNLQSRDGGSNNPDIAGIEGLHIEVKHVEKLNIWNALEQALTDCKGAIPVVFFKRNRTPWNIAVQLDYTEAFCVHFLEAMGWQCEKETA